MKISVTDNSGSYLKITDSCVNVRTNLKWCGSNQSVHKLISIELRALPNLDKAGNMNMNWPRVKAFFFKLLASPALSQAEINKLKLSSPKNARGFYFNSPPIL